MPGARIISEFSAFKLSKIGLYDKGSFKVNAGYDIILLLFTDDLSLCI